MIKLQQIVNKKWFLPLFFGVAVCISIFQHYRVFSLDIIGYHAWRQTQTQTVIQNFAHEDFSILHPKINDLYFEDGIFRREFPLAQWLIACIYKLLGDHLIITRLFFFITTLFSVRGMYKLISAITKDRLTACLTAWFFLCSPIIYFYCVNPIPDNLALCFGTWTVYYWVKHLESGKRGTFIVSALFLSLSLSVKLPFIVFGAMYLAGFYNKQREKKFDFSYILWPAAICLPPLAWYAAVIGTWNEIDIVEGIFKNDFTWLVLLDILQFNLISTLPELLINYATFPLFIIGIYYVYKRFQFKNVLHTSFFYAGSACVLYFIYEMNAIAKVHDYYLFVFMPFIFIIISKAVHITLSKPADNLKYLVLLCVIICPVTAYLRCNTRWNVYSPGFTKEYLFYKKDLRSIIPQNAKVIVHGDESRCIVLYYLDRKGWSDSEEGFSREKVQRQLKQGAGYLISDRDLHLENFVSPDSARLIFQKGVVKLYQIK